MRKKHFLKRKKHNHKITETDEKRQIITDRARTIAVRPKENVATAHTLQTAIVEVTVTLELLALKQDLTRLTRCITHCSHAIL